MPKFENLVKGQMQIMDQLLFLQEEIERCQEIEKELLSLEKKAQLVSIQETIAEKRKDLAVIQDLFQKQTEQVIQAYQHIETASSP
ncbi:YgaB family protein [Bacillus sp. CLL-7-23]|uniref:YgaB family protein n=1 Tax=Bacillus changyiensis TaxID=3004103 RepID=A0ABT4X2V3_9BACI|nr:YgaB family protein [Bacillus changyiensis]MDA7026623.1 YgaB family protein [Bacillus changyiensis]